MGNKDLNNDYMKLVKYTIVCVDRGHERILHTDERLVLDPMGHETFASWVIAEYLQAKPLADEEKKYLRVSFDVLDRWSREEFAYEERQIEVLEQIRDRLCHEGQFGTSRFGTGRFV